MGRDLLVALDSAVLLSWLGLVLALVVIRVPPIDLTPDVIPVLGCPDGFAALCRLAGLRSEFPAR